MRFFRLLLVASPAVSALACTSLLGDFSVGSGVTPQSDSGSDAPVVDSSSNDASADAVADATPDASAPKCIETPNRIKIADGVSPLSAPERIYAYARVPQGKGQPVVQAFAPFVRSENTSMLSGLSGWQFDPANPNKTVIALPEIKAKGLSIANVKAYDKGILALGFDSNQGAIVMWNLVDGAMDWVQTRVSTLSAFPSGSAPCNLTGDFAVLDAMNGKFKVVVAYSTGSNGCTTVGAAVIASYAPVNSAGVASNSLPIPAFTQPGGAPASIQIPRQGLAWFSETQAASIVAFANYTKQGASAGSGPVFYDVDGVNLWRQNMPTAFATPTGASAVGFPLALGALPAGKVGLSISTIVPPTPSSAQLITGVDAPSNLGPNTNLNGYPTVTLSPATDVPAMRSTAHWDIANQGNDVLFVSASGASKLALSSKGLNFYWIHGSGALLGARKQSEATPLFGSDIIDAVDVTYLDPPQTSGANFGVVWTSTIPNVGSTLLFDQVRCNP